MQLSGPTQIDTLTVLAWPDPITGLTQSNPDLELATPDVMANNAALDRAFESYSVEMTLADNRQFAEVYPVLSCDLQVSLDAPAQATTDGFIFSATAVRQDCPELQQVTIDVDVNGILLRDTAPFYGDTAIATFESGPLYGESSIWIEAIVDPDNLVEESNEENNRVGQRVLLDEADFLPMDEVTCPTGEPPEKCFRSRLIN